MDKVVKQTNTMNYELPAKDGLSYPKIEFKVDANFPIKILDGMIEVEEQMQNGFSIYNRGDGLKHSLIDSERVKQFLLKDESSVAQNKP